MIQTTIPPKLATQINFVECRYSTQEIRLLYARVLAGASRYTALEDLPKHILTKAANVEINLATKVVARKLSEGKWR